MYNECILLALVYIRDYVVSVLNLWVFSGEALCLIGFAIQRIRENRKINREVQLIPDHCQLVEFIIFLSQSLFTRFSVSGSGDYADRPEGAIYHRPL